MEKKSAEKQKKVLQKKKRKGKKKKIFNERLSLLEHSNASETFIEAWRSQVKKRKKKGAIRW